MQPTEGLTVTRDKHKLFQSIVGTAIYSLTQTRPDLAFSLQWLSRQLQSPTPAYVAASKGVLRYLKGTNELAILYRNDTDLMPKAYCDSDFAGCKTTAKSIYGYIFTVAGGPS